MKWLLLLTFFLLAFIEFTLLLQLSRFLSWSSIVIFCGITTGLGFWFLREEDFTLWTLAQSELQNGRLPTEELVGALLTWTAGLLFLIPGILTDALAIFLLIPPLRSKWIAWIRARLRG